MSDTLARLTPVFRDIFDNPRLMIGRDDSALTIPEWDSLAHISLVSAIEQEFGIRFGLDELAALRNIGDTVDLIERKSAR